MSRDQRLAHGRGLEMAMAFAAVFGGLEPGADFLGGRTPGRGVNVKLIPPREPRSRSPEEKDLHKRHRREKRERKKRRGF